MTILRNTLISDPALDALRSLRPGSDHPLYYRFLDLLVATVSSLIPTSLPAELDYLSECLWPIYTSSLPPHLEQNLLSRSYPDPSNPPPPLSITVKLLTDLKHQISLPLAAALENVLPRLTGRSDYTAAMLRARTVPKPPGLDLSTCARYLLVAGYCASYNPAKSDLRLFGRGTGPDGKRRRGGGMRRAGYGRTRIGKVSSLPTTPSIAKYSPWYAGPATPPRTETVPVRSTPRALRLNLRRARRAPRRSPSCFGRCELRIREGGRLVSFHGPVTGQSREAAGEGYGKR